MKQVKIISLGTMYVDINCINFPFEKGLFANRETTGNDYQLELGGSALNFAKLAAQLGLHTRFIGKVGRDVMGDVLIELLKQNTIEPAVIIDNKVQTNLAIHYIHPNGSSIMTSCGNANQTLDFKEVQKKLEQNNQADFLYLGGCFKLKSLLRYLPELAREAQKKGIRVVLDHGRVNNNVSKEDIAAMDKLIPYVDIYLPSIDEFLAVWDSKTIEEGVAKVKKVGRPLIVLKQGDLGAIGFQDDGQIAMPAFPVKAINTVGAGDSFNAGFLKAYVDGMSVRDCMKFACAVAAVKISTVGKILVDDIETYMKN